MDFSRFTPGDWLLVAGGAAMLLFGLVLDWTTVPDELGGGSGDNPFNYFFTGGIAWLLVVTAGVIAYLLAGGVIRPSATPWSLILLLGTGLATLLMLVRLILGGREIFGEEMDRGPGMYIALVAAAMALAGAAMNFARSGGRFSDLTNRDKSRGALGRNDGGTVSPPRSPGAAPPPPPPIP